MYSLRTRGAGIAVLLAALTLSPLAFAQAKDDDSRNHAGAGVEVNIGSQGNVLVRGAKVTGVSGTEIQANTSLGSSVLNWIVKTDGTTDFSTTKNGATGIANIAVGDVVSFRGAIDQSMSGLTVAAKQVKDWSEANVQAKYDGIVTSIATTLGSFVITKGDATTSVQTSSSTVFTKNGSPASFADIILNAKVKLQGMLNASSSVYTATTVEIGSQKDKNDDKNWKNGPHAWFNGWFKWWR